MDSPALYSFYLFALLLCPLTNDSERQHSRAPQTFRREYLQIDENQGRARGRAKTKGWTFVRVCCLSKGIVVAFTCAPVVRNGRTHFEREAARTVQNNPPRRTKCRGRTRQTRATGQRCSLSDCTLPEDEAQVHQGERERMGQGKEEGREIYSPINRMF